MLGKQAMYILNWQKSQLEYSRGILEMLGYTKDEFSMQMALTWIHADDIDVINRILKGVVNFAINNNVSAQKQYLNVTFRLLKKDGTYLRVMRQSLPYQTGEDGILITHLSVLTDISFMKTSTNLVEWELYAGKIDVTPFKKSIYHEFNNFFTPRELEIIHLIKTSFTNNKIASQLFISTHTVVAHRKNILKKSNCHNSKELLEFCELNGIT
ncbi:LuxR C-terminal-related transcriptional regulator [Algibacter sp.]|uniref:LuxR C-terminal-related transcriptional regulator n=1 Tax=Algibacter sp. TaxID=1872428 RepID=UPI003C718945